jgi:hypothetical protein
MECKASNLLNNPKLMAGVEVYPQGRLAPLCSAIDPQPLFLKGYQYGMQSREGII